MVQKNDELPIKAYLGVEALFKGTLSFDGIVRIDGKFEGKIQTKDTLVIGETGEIIADVEVGILVCKGKLHGTVLATEKIEMHPASTITGDVKSPALSIELGAVLDGHLNMTEKESKKVINLVEQKKQ
ncbi:MAG: polymer-forming cytoskeletal protein [Nitrospina sp.]|jgi:cytoskeletal protein CcmA (bactofilin family)|nr:polymer-forming cytoskeletal protein [Nitrospina sp.]MDG1843237.1 polymer-forming cytoskeletal protein [Nitrospinaceae bacterium]MBT4127770.1 polymer-forming cytoskeletal protein [Nitrospina sp.]MBT4258960.1 polymer-forming cytoskeletal protein [Nitrospina sp.]MBT5258927.1 polymer-forming cytoskeletal protein [Nitrospina sp.]